jgi:hypothetical protein
LIGFFEDGFGVFIFLCQKQTAEEGSDGTKWFSAAAVGRLAAGLPDGMYIFKPKITIWVNICEALDWKMLVYVCYGH